ncbi:MAG TPA: FAD-dependent oxidoreductase [Pirellulales bacterium]|jgi:glycine/D-amino acid oxidase-like deaminating enzyme/nitrite reductase/ring-hydroxylating ferredoxin subunit|nr:FAD-dependent oxidoreductase [Pirellulales bacterium]
MKTEPLWQAIRRPRFPQLKQDASFDVVVVGGGITGITTAYLLKKAGKKVCLLEHRRIGSVDTGLTTAHLTYVLDLRISKLVSTFGERVASLVLEAGALAVDMIESIVNEEHIDCDFKRVPGFLTAPFRQATDRRLKKDAQAASKLGFPARYLEQVPYFDIPGVQFPNQAKFHPLKYIYALAKRIDGGGSAIFENSKVSEIREKPLRAVANDFQVKAKYLVIATHVPITGKTGIVSATLFQTKLYPYTSYVLGAKVPKNYLPEASFWDTSDPYYYLRVESGKTYDYVIFGGNDHKTGQAPNTAERFRDLKKTLLRIIPRANVDRQWSGQVIETNDGLPYIGETEKRQFVATGFAGNGMTFGTLAARMARDAALGKENPWKQLFAVDRKKIRGGTWDYLAENVDFPYYFLKDRLTPAEGDSVSQVKAGEGKILKLDGQRVACARDAEGKIHAVSAHCTHLGCIVHWNKAESTWDCPCHGSRFQVDGSVLAGPAESFLEPVKVSRNGKPKRVAKQAQAG